MELDAKDLRALGRVARGEGWPRRGLTYEVLRRRRLVEDAEGSLRLTAAGREALARSQVAPSPPH